MISFIEATDDELKVMCEAIDALTLAQPDLIHADESCSTIVHSVVNEIHARRFMCELIEMAR